MVWQRRGLKGFYNTKTNRFQDGECNIHFHLNPQCVRKHDHTVEYKEFTTTDEVFEVLTIKQMKVLQEYDILRFI